jgi:hypothetical protein
VKEFVMIGFFRIALGLALGFASLIAPSSAEAMPGAMRGAMAGQYSNVIKAQVSCDYRGCFGYGPRQFYRRPSYTPSYRPPNGPAIYHRPRAAGVPQPPLYRAQPQLVRPLPPAAVRSPAGGNQHLEWCLGRYRSYNPTTNRYRTYRGASQICRSPYH